MTRLKLDDLPERYQRQALDQLAAIPTGLCHPQPEQDVVLPPLGQEQDEEGGPGRFAVRIERRGSRLLDADNLAGSVKFVLDALRYQKLIPEDNPAAIELEVTQAVVPKAERGTYIEITPLDQGPT